MSARVVRYHGEALDVLSGLADEFVDAVVTDPPYGLEFMGKEWDSPLKMPGHSQGLSGGWQQGPGGNSEGYRQMLGKMPEFQKFCESWARECYRVLKPGGHLLAFGGTRTSHRLASAIEDAGFEIRDSIVWLYGSGFPKSLDVSKAIDKAAGAERSEIVGSKLGRPGMAKDGSNQSYDGSDLYGSGGILPSDITAPATDDAKRWTGWGTALKPSHEPVIHAVKPLGEAGMLAEIGSRLDGLEAAWQALAVAPTIQIGAAADSSVPMDTSPFASMGLTNLSIASSWRQCWADLCSRLSMSTIATTSRATIDLKTLSSLLAQITHVSTTRALMSADGLRSLVEAADCLFAAAVLNSRAILALSVAESAIDSMPISRLGVADLAELPIVVARKPLVGTVAANVLAHGTGALHIDACRVEGDDAGWVRPSSKTALFAQEAHPWKDRLTGDESWVGGAAGRWPSNVVLDQVAAAELDEQSGTLKSGANPTRRGSDKSRDAYGDFAGQTECTPARGANIGGASRFFPVFRYQAKAPTRERPKVDGVAHPTVKPLELMRWLVRLVAAPDGIVLDPFAGSGTTLEAAVVEGMRCIGIEREETYLPLIAERMARAGLVAL